MKNPIGGIINFSAMLLEDDMTTKDQKAIIKDIEQSAYSVLNMVNLSLDLYRMEQGTYEFNPCKIDVVQILNRIIKEKKSELDTRISPCSLWPTARWLRGMMHLKHSATNCLLFDVQ